MSSTDKRVSHYLNQFAESKNSLPGTERPWIGKLREDAIGQFGYLGFPTAKLEEWRFTNVTPIAQKQYVPGRISVTTFADAQKVQVTPLADVFQSDGMGLEGYFGKIAGVLKNPFVALNAALWSDGIYVRIPAGTVEESPIHLIWRPQETGQNIVMYPRVLVVVEKNAQAKLVEDFEGTGGKYFNNAVTEIVLEEGASLDYYRLQKESNDAFHISTVEVRQGKNSQFRSHTITIGGMLVRNDLTTTLNDRGSDTIMNGLYLVGDRQHVDNHTMIDHAQPHCTSRELYKGILDGNSHAVFNGKIIVRPDAQKTDSMQTNKNLLLSDQGRVDTKPELEIFANDVKCKHGAAVGQLNPDMLFYLRSRGISEEQAKHMIIFGFASELIHGIEIAPIRNELTEMLFGRLALSSKGFTHV